MKSEKTTQNLSQAEKFAEAARKLGADESEEKFDQALKRVGKAKLTHPPRPNKETASRSRSTEEGKPKDTK